MIFHCIRPVHFCVMFITIPLSVYYLILVISDISERFQTTTVSKQVLQLVEENIYSAGSNKADVSPTNVIDSWDDLLQETALDEAIPAEIPVTQSLAFDLDGPRKWLQEQLVKQFNSQEVEENNNIVDNIVTITEAPIGPSPPYNLMEETFGTDWKTNAFFPNNCTVDYINTNRLQQDHPCVIAVIRRLYLHQPILTDVDVLYKMAHPEVVDPPNGQSKAILQILRNQTEGYFVECGAYDGEYLSNTLYMERSLRWNGVLIEANKKSYRKLRARNRRVQSLPVCISPETYPVQATINTTLKSDSVDKQPPIVYKLMKNPTQSEDGDVYTVQCFPLYSILLAVNRSQIDFLSLNIEGHEFKVLKTVPWNKVDVTAISVEWSHVPEGEDVMSRYMKTHGFVKFGQIGANSKDDVIYVKDFLKGIRG